MPTRHETRRFRLQSAPILELPQTVESAIVGASQVKRGKKNKTVKQMKTYPILLKHVNGKTRLGYVRSIVAGSMWITWAPEGSEGVEINEATERSKWGCWSVIG